jgi:integral membrane sensor domain MASE1
LLLGWQGVLGYFIAVLALITSGVFPELDSLEDALVIAAVACLLKVGLGVELLEDFARNVSLTVLGDTLGTIIVLAVLIRLRKAYKRSVQAEQSEAV